MRIQGQKTFGRYHSSSKGGTFVDDEYLWRVTTLDRILGGKVFSEINFQELSSNFDCLYELNADDFGEIFLALIYWYLDEKDVDEIFFIIVNRMGFIDFRKKNYGSLGQPYEKLFSQMREVKLRCRSVRKNFLAVSYDYLVHIKQDVPSWKRFFEERKDDYVCRLFLRWCSHAWGMPGTAI